jgi:serine/threonine-protein kinase
MTMAEIDDLPQEAVILSQIGHPNIVRVFDAKVLEIPQGVLGYFTMDYVARGSLEQHWKSNRIQPMPVRAAVNIVRQACR